MLLFHKETAQLNCLDKYNSEFCGILREEIIYTSMFIPFNRNDDLVVPDEKGVWEGRFPIEIVKLYLPVGWKVR